LPDLIPRLADALWLFALLVPLGWWAPSVAWAVVGAAVQLGLLRLLPLAAPLAPPPSAQYAAVLLGLAFGLALRRFLAPRADGSTWLER
jgi:endonuclease/exonuclease/phosphatase (EEP) superfamily protein YafD